MNYPYPEELLSTLRDESGEWEWRVPFDPNTQDVTGQTSLYVACLLGNKPLVEYLLNWCLKCSQTMLSRRESSSLATASVSPTKRRISYGIQSIMSRLSLGRDPIENAPDAEETYRNPMQVNLLCGAARETALLAAVRGDYIDVLALLLNHGADPNFVAKAVEDHSDPK